MKPDPKFGWHILWISPLAVLVMAWLRFSQVTKSMKRERTWSKEQIELQILAGIRDRTGKKL